MKNLKRFLNILNRLPLDLILIVCLSILVLFRYFPYFFSSIDINEFAQKYSTSQYILGEASPQKISDSELYVYASFAYVKGEDPTTINFEHPPLAKYFYGVFLEIFANPYWGSLVLFIGNLLLLNSISKILKLKLAARMLIIILTGSLSLFQVHTRYALLDLPQLFGILLFFFSYLKLESNIKSTNKVPLKYLMLLGVSLGIIIGVKYWFPLIAVFILLTFLQMLRTKKYLIYFVPFLICASIYLLSYTMYFYYDHNAFDLIDFEKYRFSWFMGKVDAPKGLIFQTLFTGKYKVWWDENLYEVTKHWSLIWPATFIASIISFIIACKQRAYQVLLLLGYSYLVLAIFSIGSAASDRFFIQLIPFWSISCGYLLQLILQRKSN